MEQEKHTKCTKTSAWCMSKVSFFWILEFGSLLGLTLGSESKQYGVVIDAGSSGSRVRLYEWTRRISMERLPVFDEFFSKKVEPGISDFKGDKLDGLKPYLKQLVDAAITEIPQQNVEETSLYLMATAGMRLLLEPRANAVMEKIQEVLSDPEICPFRFSDNQARILSGEEEGVFAWITANYLNNYFDAPDEQESAGILELGGASTQIAFVPDGSILADKFPVRLAGRTYPLYVHSYLYYGQNYAELWVKEYLHRQLSHGSSAVANPCMLKGDSSKDNISNIIVNFEGSGEPLECNQIVQQLVYKVQPYQCYPKPCAVGSVYQPTISDDKPFFALSAFAYPLKTLDVLDENGIFTPNDTYHSALNYCQKPIDLIINETQRAPDFLSVECLMGLYIPTLFTRGYGFANNTRQVAAKFDINGQPAEWPLGAIIYETERQSVRICSKAHTLPNTMMVIQNRASSTVLTMYVIGLIVCHNVFKILGC